MATDKAESAGRSIAVRGLYYAFEAAPGPIASGRSWPIPIGECVRVPDGATTAHLTVLQSATGAVAK